MNVAVVIRDGEVKLRLPHPEIKADGSVWSDGTPVIDSQSEGVQKIGLDTIKQLAKARKFGNIPADCLGHLGTSASGLIIMSADAYREQQRAALTPAQRDRGEIESLYAQAERRLNDRDDCNTMDHFRLQGAADARLKAWRLKYPSEAATQDADNLRDRADDQRSLATGALLYDADGSLSPEAQQQRHDEFLARAAELDSQAAALVNG